MPTSLAVLAALLSAAQAARLAQLMHRAAQRAEAWVDGDSSAPRASLAQRRAPQTQSHRGPRGAGLAQVRADTRAGAARLNTTAGRGQCAVPDHRRRDCGYVGVDQGQCEARGCCWKQGGHGAPWCLHGEAAGPAPVEDQCAVPDRQRNDCGFMGEAQGQCEAKGCCWRPGGHGTPWCFQGRGGAAAAPTGDAQCAVPEAEKRDCGSYGVKKDTCESKGCCWRETRHGGLWCFHKNGGSSEDSGGPEEDWLFQGSDDPARTEQPPASVPASWCHVALRQECGFMGASEGSCVAKGCCRKPCDHSEAWCFHPQDPDNAAAEVAEAIIGYEARPYTTLMHRYNQASDLPSWWAAAGAGDLAELDHWTRVPRQRRAESEWRRMAVKLARLRRLKEFDSALGFPGEGPRRSACSRRSARAVVMMLGLAACLLVDGARVAGEAPAARPAVDLRTRPQTTTQTAQMRQLLLRQVENWLLKLDGGCELASLVVQGPRVVANAVAARGRALYSPGRSLKHCTETINAVVGVERSLRRHMGAARDVAQAWQFAVPTRHRCPTPVPVLRALVPLALSWGWIDMAVLALLAFTCMLRPGEARGLCFSDLLLPSQLMSDDEVCCVRVHQPKARWAVARMEHARCDEVVLVRLLERLAAGQQKGPQIFRGSYPHFRRCHDAQFFGIAATEAHGLTPASHRGGGGATFCFEECEDLPRTQWRGRWRQLKSMEICIQEVAAVALVPNMAQASRQLVASFAAALPGLLARATDRLVRGQI
ncbi:unnamed protein product [Prorocentrum cordatum]|uniref:P-type domain-containing protein n=1 Tax=Prorocentrum cordatum TaxID=2364126 RepID=A0ABN9S351_9DINO|nr:unnamed protein product [Polarella glacialis]